MHERGRKEKKDEERDIKIVMKKMLVPQINEELQGEPQIKWRTSWKCGK